MLSSEPSNGENKFVELEKTIKQCTLTEQAGGSTLFEGTRLLLLLKTCRYGLLHKSFYSLI